MNYRFATTVPPSSTGFAVSGDAITLATTSTTTVTVVPDGQATSVTISLAPGVVVPLAVSSVTTGAGVSVIVLGG
jgi:hypothetical protein